MSAPTIPELHPPFFYHRLTNGMEMIGHQMPSLGSAVFGIQLGVGARDEEDGQLGLGQLLEDMLFQGTPTRSSRQITDSIELLGARRIVGTNFETTRYGAQVVHTRLEPALELWADLILHPTLPRKEFDQLKPLLIQAIRRREDEPMRRVGELIMQSFYRESRLARPLLGTLETVEPLRTEDLRAFYDKYYRADKALFAIAGNFDWDWVVQKVSALFGDWAGGGAPSHLDTPQPGDTIAVMQEKGEQEHVYLAYPSVTFGDPDYYANILMCEIFGGGMTSRLFSEVREKRGLVYQVSAFPQPSQQIGAVMIYAGSTPEKGHETVEVIMQELRKLGEHGVTQNELDLAKVQIKSELVMQSESSSSRMGGIARSWWYERRISTIAEIKAKIDAVTVEQIASLLQRFPPTHPLTLAALGPVSQADLVAGIWTN